MADNTYAKRQRLKRRRDKEAGLIDVRVKVRTEGQKADMQLAAKKLVEMKGRADRLTGVYVVVPEPCADAIKRIAKQMCEEADTANLNEEIP